jgi:hypothetical protein
VINETKKNILCSKMSRNKGHKVSRRASSLSQHNTAQRTTQQTFYTNILGVQ